MDSARLWLRDNPAIREAVVETCQTDPRLEHDAPPDALLTDPGLLVDMTKELICEVVRRDAPEGVAEELLVELRRMTDGVGKLSPYIRTVLVNLRGLRDSSEVEPVLRNALGHASEEDRRRLEGMIDVVQKADSVMLADEVVLPERTGFSPVDCVACCVLGCTFCFEACPVCCAVGCVVCG
jgi:hypothetical protein